MFPFIRSTCIGTEKVHGFELIFSITSGSLGQRGNVMRKKKSYSKRLFEQIFRVLLNLNKFKKNTLWFLLLF